MAINLIRAAMVFIMMLSFHACAVQTDKDSGLHEDWIKVSAGSVFSLTAPGGTTFHPSQGLDSFVGAFTNQKFRIDFDYGLYSDPLTNYSGQPDYKIQELQIDNRKARIISYSDPTNTQYPYFIGVHFYDLGKTMLGTTKLTVFSRLKDKKDYPTLEKIYRSIKFR